MQKKMRIAVMADDSFDLRPERTLCYRLLIERLAVEEGVELTIVHSKSMPDEPIYSRVREILIPQIKLPYATRFVSFIRFCLTTREEFDIVHWFKPRVFPFFWLFPAKKVVIMTHGGGDVLVPGLWTFSRKVFNYTIIWFQKHIDAMIAVSEYANKEIIYAYRVPPEKVVTIYNGLDPELFDSPPSEQTIRKARAKYKVDDRPYFIYMGRARIHKNVGNLVKGFIRYREQNPDAHEILVIGGDGRAGYERTFGPLPQSIFAADIRFINNVDPADLPGLYGGATALGFITLNEGFGMPPVEAMACGTPAIISHMTALPEVAGGAAIIVDPYDINAIAQALALTCKEDVRKILIARGLKRAHFFSEENRYQATLALYRELISSKPALIFDPD